MKIEYQITYTDYREANLSHQTPRSKPQRILLAVVLTAMAGVAFWVALRPMHGVTALPTTGPIGLGDAFGSLLQWLPWAGLVLIVLIISRTRQISAKRRFVVAPESRSLLFSAPAVILTALVLATATMIIADVRQSVRQPAASTGFPSDSICYLFVVLYLAIYFLLLRGNYRRNWKLQPSLARPRTLEYSPEAVTTDDGVTMVMHRWPAFLRCVETRGLFLLYPSGLGFVMVPKRAFPSPEAVDGFRRLIQEWADGQSAGFPVIQRAPQHP